MKKYILFVLLTILIFTNISHSVDLKNEAVIAQLNSGGGGGACTGILLNNEAAIASDFDIGDTSALYYVGQGDINESTGTSYDICKITAVVSLGAGDISGKTFKAYISAQDANDDFTGVLSLSNGVTGSNAWSETAVEFTFATDVTIAANTPYAMGVTMQEEDAANYADLSFSSSGAIEGVRRTYDSSGVFQATTSVDAKLIVYYRE